MQASASIEDDPACASNRSSAIKQHTKTTNHDIHPKYRQILESNEINNYLNWKLFLGSSHSSLDQVAVKEGQSFPRAYVPLLRFQGSKHDFCILIIVPQRTLKILRVENFGDVLITF